MIYYLTLFPALPSRGIEALCLQVKDTSPHDIVNLMPQSEKRRKKMHTIIQQVSKAPHSLPLCTLTGPRTGVVRCAHRKYMAKAPAAAKTGMAVWTGAPAVELGAPPAALEAASMAELTREAAALVSELSAPLAEDLNCR